MNKRSVDGQAIRDAGSLALARALQASRHDTLATFAAFECALAASSLAVPKRSDLNPPLWELGHIGWFQEFWLARNPQRSRGIDADPLAPRMHGVRAGADGLYDSSLVPHGTRWSLPLPSAGDTRADLRAQLETTQALLRQSAPDDVSLYFFRLALLHEDMHHEAALYMAQALGIPIADPRWQPSADATDRSLLRFNAATWKLGGSSGFAFDNELHAHDLSLPPFDIDCRVVNWDEYLPFVEADGYADPRWWSDAGRRWLAAAQANMPRYLRCEGTDWMQWQWGRWQPLNRTQPACHLAAYEAEAWCAWAGRRLPTEGEWECAAVGRPDDFAWGEVWEWTSSVFAAYPGFTPHPYRDYSAPWFGSRPVLRGASFGTQPRMHHPRYRNYFTAERNDIFAGFRSCAHTQ